MDGFAVCGHVIVDGHNVTKIDEERARLEREALKATKEYRQYFFPPDAAKDLKPDSPGNRFLIAVDALLEFEAKQK